MQRISELRTSRNDNGTIRERIIPIDSERRKSLGINKSILWYQQKRIKEEKLIKVYEKDKDEDEMTNDIPKFDEFLDFLRMRKNMI